MTVFFIIKNLLIFCRFRANLGSYKDTSKRTAIPHDAQVRRISWVVGSVDWHAKQKRFLVPHCMLVDPQLQNAAFPGEERRFLFSGVECASRI
jgi:hypothetical protein